MRKAEEAGNFNSLYFHVGKHEKSCLSDKFSSHLRASVETALKQSAFFRGEIVGFIKNPALLLLIDNENYLEAGKIRAKPGEEICDIRSHVPLCYPEKPKEKVIHIVGVTIEDFLEDWNTQKLPREYYQCSATLRFLAERTIDRIYGRLMDYSFKKAGLGF